MRFVIIDISVTVRFRGLAKNTAQLVTLFALSNLWMARRYLLADAGEVRVFIEYLREHLQGKGLI